MTVAATTAAAGITSAIPIKKIRRVQFGLFSPDEIVHFYPCGGCLIVTVLSL